MLNESRLIFVRGKIVAICQAILNEEMGVIAGSRILCGLEFELRYDLYQKYDCDEDLLPLSRSILRRIIYQWIASAQIGVPRRSHKRIERSAKQRLFTETLALKRAADLSHVLI